MGHSVKLQLSDKEQMQEIKLLAHKLCKPRATGNKHQITDWLQLFSQQRGTEAGARGHQCFNSWCVTEWCQKFESDPWMEKNIQQGPWDYAKYPLSKCNLSEYKDETSNSVTLTKPNPHLSKNGNSKFSLKNKTDPFIREGFSDCELHLIWNEPNFTSSEEISVNRKSKSP